MHSYRRLFPALVAEKHFILIFNESSEYQTNSTSSSLGLASTIASLGSWLPAATTMPTVAALTPPPTPQPSPQADSNLLINDMCQSMGVSLTAVEAAQYKRNQPLLHLVRNFMSMKRILETLGFGNRGQRGKSEKVRASNSHFMVDTHQVLQHFDWSPSTYANKAAIFIWARDMVTANKQWDSSKGIVFLSP